MAGKLRIDGVDISHYQSSIKIDWDAAKNAGLRFLYHKATEGTSVVDASYAPRRVEAAKNGVPFGGYHFARPEVGNAEAEAEHFLKTANPKPGDMRPMLDLEVNGGLNIDQLTTWVNTWFSTVFAAIGQRRGLLYTHYNLTKKPSGVLLWVPRYSDSNSSPVVPKPFWSWAVWQFSDGKYGNPSYMPGIGRVDLNTIHKMYPWATLSALRFKGTKAAPKAARVAPAVVKPAGLDFTDPLNYPSHAHPHSQTTGPQITWLGEQLVAHGFSGHYSVGPGPNFGPSDKENVADFQRAQGWTGSDADGYPGHDTLALLAAKPAPKPKAPKASKESAAARLLRIAGAQVGYHEGRSNGHWNNHQKFSPAVPGLEWSQNQAWCATFVSWVAMKAGLAAYFPRTASTDAGAKWFKDKGQWSEYPAVPSQVYYGSGDNMDHTGLVYKYDDDYIYTVEGNTNTNGSVEGDGVYRKKRPRHASYVRGYGYPKIPGVHLKSADPTYK